MKKFFTLFMATVVAVSMSALPQVKKDLKVGQVQKSEFTAKQQASFEKAVEITKSVERKAVVKQAQEKVAPAATLAPTAKLAPAAKAAKEEITLNFSELAYLEYYPDRGWRSHGSCGSLLAVV